MSPLNDIEYLRALFFVTDGVLRHARACNGFGGRKYPGDPAGALTHNGYVMCTVEGERMQAHKIVWALENNCFPQPGFDIDHIDGDKTNNSPDNLRLATRSQNNYNARKRRNNTSGFKGVSFDKSRGRWDARIRAEGKTRYLGRFDTAEAAKAAYDAAAKTLHDTFRRSA